MANDKPAPCSTCNATTSCPHRGPQYTRREAQEIALKTGRYPANTAWDATGDAPPSPRAQPGSIAIEREHPALPICLKCFSKQRTYCGTCIHCGAMPYSI